jgi:hypothetical protein
MHTLIAAVGLGASLLCGASAQRHSCDAADPEFKKALGYLIDDAYHIGSVSSEDNEELDWGRRVVVRRGENALPCLVEIAQHGLRGSGLWPQASDPPNTGRWAIDLIRAIDAPTAIALMKDWRSEPGLDDMGRIRLSVEIASLGDDAALPEITRFLTNPPAQVAGDQRVLRSVQERAVEVISIRNYRLALPALQHLYSDRGPVYAKHWRWLPVYIAQLSGDAELVTRYAHDPELATWALRALSRMGRDDLLRKLANDPAYRHRAVATTLLAGEPSP